MTDFDKWSASWNAGLLNDPDDSARVARAAAHAAWQAAQPKQQPAHDSAAVRLDKQCREAVAAALGFIRGGDYAWSYLLQQIKDITSAAEARQPVSRQWSYCPECGSEHVRHHEGEHKQCANCHQEWFSGIDYADVVRKHLSSKFRYKDAEQQHAPDVAQLVEALECFVEWYEQVNLRNEPRFQFYDKAKKALAAFERGVES